MMKLKVGLIGCGSISELRHAPEYKMNENVEIMAFCDPQPERAEKLANQYGGKAFSDYREVLKIADLDAVSVCT
jgi:predicted dehydrogenase